MFLVALGTQHLFAANKPWIGVYLQDVTADLAEAFNLSVKKGALVNDVTENSPAEEAGLKPKDVILAWDGKSVTDSQMLTELVGAGKVGDKVKLSVNRGGKEIELALTVGERKEARVYGEGNSERDRALKEYSYSYNMKRAGIGVSMQSLSGDLGDYFGVANGNGALITQVMKDTPAQRAGLKTGDVIVKVDNESVESPSDVSSIIGEKQKGDKVDLVVVREKAEKSFALEVDEIESLGGTESQGGLDALNSLDWQALGLRHDGKSAPRVFRIDPGDEETMQKQLEELQTKLEEMQRKLEKLESKMK
jgi:serine protease Do